MYNKYAVGAFIYFHFLYIFRGVQRSFDYSTFFKKNILLKTERHWNHYFKTFSPLVFVSETLNLEVTAICKF